MIIEKRIASLSDIRSILLILIHGSFNDWIHTDRIATQVEDGHLLSRSIIDPAKQDIERVLLEVDVMLPCGVPVPPKGVILGVFVD